MRDIGNFIRKLCHLTEQNCRSSSAGDGYLGTKSKTGDDDETDCLDWSSTAVQTLLSGLTMNSDYEVEQNYCRNPTLVRTSTKTLLQMKEPWYYTLRNGVVRKRHCGDPYCSKFLLCLQKENKKNKQIIFKFSFAK